MKDSWLFQLALDQGSHEKWLQNPSQGIYLYWTTGRRAHTTQLQTSSLQPSYFSHILLSARG